MATFRSSVLIAIIVASLACVRAADAPEPPPTGARGPAPAVSARPAIEHVTPARYWAVGAFRDGRQVAYFGRSALVVLK